jgi:hypothetical protein
MHYISGGQAHRRTHVMNATVPIPSWNHGASTVPIFSSVRACREDLVGGIAILGLYSFPCCLQNKNGVLHPCTFGCTTGRVPKRTFSYLTSHLVSGWRPSVAPLCHSILCVAWSHGGAKIAHGDANNSKSKNCGDVEIAQQTCESRGSNVHTSLSDA